MLSLLFINQAFTNKDWEDFPTQLRIRFTTIAQGWKYMVPTFENLFHQTEIRVYFHFDESKFATSRNAEDNSSQNEGSFNFVNKSPLTSISIWSITQTLAKRMWTECIQNIRYRSIQKLEKAIQLLLYTLFVSFCPQIIIFVIVNKPQQNNMHIFR